MRSHLPYQRYTRLCLAVTVISLTWLAGCAAPVATSRLAERERLAQLDYPADAERGPDLDIVVRREGTGLTLINRTARPYRDVRVWINQQYARDLAAIPIGPGGRLDLTRWVNEHEEPFPVGSFLAPEKAFPVILAELIDLDTGLRHRLLVWPDPTNSG
ncbi:MAG: hypothetical protein AAGH99_08965 [Planctomycetota bacterium]